MPNASNAKISSVVARPVMVPMAQPHRTASGAVSDSPLVLVDITTDEGITGHSIVFTYTKIALKPTTELIASIGELIKGDRLSPLEVEEKLNRHFRLLGTQGLVYMAMAGIDMALWDALARTSGLPLVTMLGGTQRSFPAYGSIGYDGPAGSAREAERWANLGMQGVKAKIGYPTVEEDREVLRAIRSAIGEERAIMVDYNQSLSPTDAVQRLSQLEDEGLTWIEEPTLAHDHLGHAHIADRIQTPIQCGENWWGVLDLQHAIDAQASDFVMLDVMKVGGVTGWMRGAALTGAKNIVTSSHLWPELSARLLCCTPTPGWLEYCDWWNPIVKNPLVLQNGHTAIDDSIGSGLEWNEEVIQDCLVCAAAR